MIITYNKLNDLRIRMIKIVREYGYTVPNDITMSSLLDILETVQFVDNSKKENYGVVVDDIGYITEIVKIDGVIQLKNQPNQEIPEDVFRGYYTIKDKKIVLDEERKRILT